MQRYLITTASTLALILGAANFATAASPVAQSSVPATPTGPNSLGAGAIMRQGDMKNDPAMKKRHSSEPRAENSTYRSFSATEQSLAGTTVAGGMNALELLGADVTGPSGQEIGQVRDLAIGSDNTISKAIIEVGGFLGMGSKYVVVSAADLKQGDMEGNVVTAMTKGQLEAAPRFEKEGKMWVRAKSAGPAGSGTSSGATTGGGTSPAR